MPNDDLDRRVQAIIELLRVFKLERFVYLIINILSFIILIVSATFLHFNHMAVDVVYVGLFGSTGGIICSTGLLLRMWSQALQYIHPIVTLEGDRNVTN